MRERRRLPLLNGEVPSPGEGVAGGNAGEDNAEVEVQEANHGPDGGDGGADKVEAVGPDVAVGGLVVDKVLAVVVEGDAQLGADEDHCSEIL